MNLLKVTILFSCFLSPLLGKEKGLSKMTYVYRRDSKGKYSTTTWTVEKKEKSLLIQGMSEGGKTRVITLLPLDTRSFSYQSKSQKNAYYIDRSGPCLIAKKVENGHVTQKKFNIGNDFWIQEFDFSMRAFILSKAHSLKFYTVHPTRLSLHYMVAIKSNAIDRVTVRDQSYDALRVKITLVGIKKMMWKADLWFDPNTGDLLKYTANEGPNTPISVISLFSKKSIRPDLWGHTPGALPHTVRYPPLKRIHSPRRFGMSRQKQLI